MRSQQCALFIRRLISKYLECFESTTVLDGKVAHSRVVIQDAVEAYPNSPPMPQPNQFFCFSQIHSLRFANHCQIFMFLVFRFCSHTRSHSSCTSHPAHSHHLISSFFSSSCFSQSHPPCPSQSC